MIEIVKQTVDFYMKNLQIPNIDQITINDKQFLEQKGSYFVTIYYKGDIRGSAGNIKEINENSVLELINNTISAISKDSRFKPLQIDESKEIKIRVDNITEREVLKDKKINSIDPTNFGVIVIKKDYTKMASILPNIDPKLFSGEDFIPVLEEKLNEKKFIEDDYIIYKIKTNIETNF